MSEICLDIQHLSMRFGGIIAVNDLSFTIEEGDIFGLIGPNGAGKTTVFNCITQFYKADAGKILFHNRDNKEINLAELETHQIVGHGLARTFQNIELIKELSVLDNILVGSHIEYKTGFLAHGFRSPKTNAEERAFREKAESIIDLLGLSSRKDLLIAGQPYGVFKYVEFARALMSNPKLIILDEPAAGLNEAETETLIGALKKIQSEFKCTILLVEHDMKLVMTVCNKICAISFGKKLAVGAPKEIQRDPLVQEAYLGKED